MNKNNLNYFNVEIDKIFIEEKLDFLKTEEAVISLANLIALIGSKKGPETGDWWNTPRYKNIEECLDTNAESLGDFEELTQNLLSSVQKAKVLLFKNGAKVSLDIQENFTLTDLKNQLKKIFTMLRPHLKTALEKMKKIKDVNPELLFCFFNYQTWGSTWQSELTISQKTYKYKTWSEVVDIALNRVLKFELYNEGFHLSYWTVSNFDENLYNNLGAVDYEKYRYTTKDYFTINSRISRQILDYFVDIIIKLRDSCRTVLSSIKNYKSKNEKFGTAIFQNVLKELIEPLQRDDAFKKYFANKELKKKVITLISLLYDYKKEVEESEWIITSKFKTEIEFQNHLFNYLNRTRNSVFQSSKEAQRSRGKIDILVYDTLTIELKFNDKPVKIETLSKYHPQLRETMETWSSKIGFLILLDVSSQNEFMSSRENYFEATVVKGGRGVSTVLDENPVGIISVLIFGGSRVRPSSLT